MLSSVSARPVVRRLGAIAFGGILATSSMACSGDPDALDPDPEPVPSSSLATSANVVTLGDSQTAGAWLADPATESWPAQLDGLLCPERTCVTNLAIGGQPIGTVTADGPRPLLETLDEQLAASGTATAADAAVILIGQLDLVSNDDVDQILGWYDELDERLTALGIDEVYFATLLPFDTEAHPNPEWIPQLEIRRAAINDGIRARWGPEGHVIELDDVLTEPDSAEFRPDLSIKDGNHLSAEGSRIVAVEVESHLRTSFDLSE